MKGNDCIKRVYSPDGVSPTLTTMGGGQREPKVAIRTANANGYDLAKEGDSIDTAYPSSSTRRGRVGHGVSHTITASDNESVLLSNYRIRKLTERECWRLQAFSDEDIDKVKATGMSKTQMYRQTGNSICVAVLEAIFKELFHV